LDLLAFLRDFLDRRADADRGHFQHIGCRSEDVVTLALGDDEKWQR
jgi:hypothetical protein